MKRTRVRGIPFGVFDELHEALRKDHEEHSGPGHECGPACDPPTEAELLAFYRGLDAHQRELLRFIGMLHHHGYGVPLQMWQGPLPLELQETGASKH